jgi:hypothetical protein
VFKNYGIFLIPKITDGNGMRIGIVQLQLLVQSLKKHFLFAWGIVGLF